MLFIKKNYHVVFFVIFSLMYLFGILSTAHYTMGRLDFFINLVVVFLSSLGLLVWFLNHSISKIGVSTLTWLALLFCVALQPLFNHITYPDALLFPIALLSVATLLSLVGVNVDQLQKERFIYSVSILLAIGASLTFLTQVVQLVAPNTMIGFIARSSDRIYGNLAQPNQSAFVLILGLTSLFYFMHKIQSHARRFLYWGGLAVLAGFFAMGVGLTASRAGVLMAVASLIGVLFYPWQKHQYRFGVFVVMAGVCLFGYQLGTTAMNTMLATETSAVGRLVGEQSLGMRQALLARAWDAFLSDPLTGIGYGNYLSFGVNHMADYSFFENASHSHNFITQLLAELGVLGIACLFGIAWVLTKKVGLFLTFKLTANQVFLYLTLLIFVLYSLSEYPLWYARYLFVAVFLIALLDDGFDFKNFNFHKILTGLSLIITLLSAGYIKWYDDYLMRYEAVMMMNMTDGEKVEAYKTLPVVFGFSKFKEEMLHMLMTEDDQNIKAQIELGYRVMNETGSIDVMNFQARALVRADRAEEADKVYQILCMREHHSVGRCDHTLMQILERDESDVEGYAKRLHDWYQQWLAKR